MRKNQLKPAPGSKTQKFRVGRGFTGGKTCGRGHKGYRSRSGSSVSPAFEGGQTPLQRRLPKVGFRYVHKKRYHHEIRVDRLLNQLMKVELENQQLLDINWLVILGLVPRSASSVKIIGAPVDPKTITSMIKSLKFDAAVTMTSSVRTLLGCN